MKTLLVAAALLITAATDARATVIDTFSFNQGGFTGQIAPGNLGLLSGTFTVTDDGTGFFTMADLLTLNLTYQSGNATLFGYGMGTQAFSLLFRGNGVNQNFDLETIIGLGTQVCTDGIAELGLLGCASGGAPGSIGGLDTTLAFTNVDLISSISSTPLPVPTPNPAPSPVPEPSTFTILAVAVVALSWPLSRRRFGKHAVVS